MQSPQLNLDAIKETLKNHMELSASMDLLAQLSNAVAVYPEQYRVEIMPLLHTTVYRILYDNSELDTSGKNGAIAFKPGKDVIINMAMAISSGIASGASGDAPVKSIKERYDSVVQLLKVKQKTRYTDYVVNTGIIMEQTRKMVAEDKKHLLFDMSARKMALVVKYFDSACIELSDFMKTGWEDVKELLQDD